MWTIGSKASQHEHFTCKKQNILDFKFDISEHS